MTNENVRNRSTDAVADLIDANAKRTYDVYQDLDVQLARRSLDHYSRICVIAERVLNNAANVDNIANLQAVAHRDIAIDSEWVPGPGEENIKQD